jgi:phosphoribosylformimino-5-aminoimidazole carboxamide ribotide isomerase
MTFTIYPAIDLKGGRVVRLAEGDMARATVYGDDPAAQAAAFAQAGATALHVVDLDGAFAGSSVNGAAVERIVAAFPGKVQMGGGIRSRAALDAWLARGVDRVVLGTAALADPNFVVSAARANPGRIVVAVDAKGGMVATRGWAEVSTVPVAELAKRFEGIGIAALLFTDVGRDGMLKGVNLPATLALAQSVSIPVLASGGVAGPQDIDDLRLHMDDGIEGVIIGRAIYDGRLDLADALRRAA